MHIENWHVYNLDEAIRASKFPMAADVHKLNNEITNTVKNLGNQPRGSAHDNFLNGILVTFDLTCSNKMWIEFERYHFAEIISGQSTMHSITKLLNGGAPFNSHVDSIIKDRIFELVKIYKEHTTARNYLNLLYSIPSGLELTNHITTNYGQLKTMYNQRYNHRLPEWREFCNWILTLPHFTELTGITNKGEKE